MKPELVCTYVNYYQYSLTQLSVTVKRVSTSRSHRKTTVKKIHILTDHDINERTGIALISLL